jgi:sortase A
MEKTPTEMKMTIFSNLLGIIGIITILHNGYWFWHGATLEGEKGDFIQSYDQPTSYQSDEKHFTISKYEEGDLLGHLYIPAIDLQLPIYHGTTEAQLKRGIGHYQKSVLPGQNNNSVLAGHRDTYFRSLENIKVKDEIWTYTKQRKALYKVIKTRIVDKDDRTVLVEKPKGTLTLITCYPFTFIGSAPERFIVIAELIQE